MTEQNDFFDDDKQIILSPENWTPGLEAICVFESAQKIFNEIFKEANIDSKKAEAFRRYLWEEGVYKDCRERRLGGESLEKEFSEGALSNSDEVSQGYTSYALIYAVMIAASYASDAIIKTLENYYSREGYFYLNRANYFLGISRGVHSERIGQKDDKAQRMREIANLRHARERENVKRLKGEVERIWDSHNWRSFTECAEHVFQKKNGAENYRKIYDLVREVAKTARQKNT